MVIRANVELMHNKRSELKINWPIIKLTFYSVNDFFYFV